MSLIWFHASHEQFPPSHLLKLAVLAEKAGFDGIHSSDHFHPWSARQGHSGYSFSWIGAAMQATALPFSLVCAPGQRYHPAIIAQAIATLSEMFPDRFHIELGSGEALNEVITGQGWPAKAIRNQRLLECATVIRRLLSGEEVTFNGLVQVSQARLYTLPLRLPPLFCAAISEQTCSWAGGWADGLLTTAGDVEETKAKVKAYRRNGGGERPVSLQLAFSFEHSRPAAVMGAWDQWRSNLLSPEKLANVQKVTQFDAATSDISPDEVAEAIPIFTSIEELQEHIQPFQTIAQNIILHNVNRNQEAFIQEYHQFTRY